MKPISVTYLYPDQMSLYGDRANILVLRKRMQWRDIPVEICQISPGETRLPESDIIFIGGGQDHDQEMIVQDMLRHKSQLSDLVESGASLLAICGGYQLLGESYQTSTSEIEGLGLLPYHTERAQAGQDRIIGNLICETEHWGTLWGYENHGGRTHLSAGLEPLGRVMQGGGNNGIDHTEGVMAECGQGLIMGTYFHTFLPKNPIVADYLIWQATSRYMSGEILPLPSDIAARDQIITQQNHKVGMSLKY